jgi:hypothetical protein
MTDEAMSPLRRRMIEDMSCLLVVGGLSSIVAAQPRS